MGQAAIRAACAAGLLQCGHGRIPGGRRPALLLSGDEHPPAGGAPGYGAGHGAGSGPPADRNRRRRAAAVHAGGDRVARRRHRMPHLRRGPLQRFPALPRHDHPPHAAARPRHPPGWLRVPGLDGPDGIRSAARQTRRVGGHARSRDCPHAPCAPRIRCRRYTNQPRLLPADSGRPRVPGRESAHGIHRRILSAAAFARALGRSGRGRCPGWCATHGRGQA